MATKYTTTEFQSIETLLKKVPRGVNGALPFIEWKETNEWKLLLKNHPESSIKQKMTKIWSQSVIEVQPPKIKESVSLNHAYNFCPGCGMKLN